MPTAARDSREPAFLGAEEHMSDVAKLLDKKSVVEVVEPLGMEDLRYLNRRIVEWVKFLSRLRNVREFG
jgi:hypothetical protein